MKNKIKWLFFTIGVVTLIIACNKDTLFTSEQPVNKNGVSCAVSMEYEVETVTILRPENPSDLANLSDFDKIEATPKVSRDFVSVCITETGDFDISAISKQPLNPYDVPHETLPDDSPKVHEMKIQNDMIRSYDKQGNLLYEFATDPETITTYQDLVSMMQQIAAIDDEVIEGMIETAQNSNNVVLELGNGIVGVQTVRGSQIVELLIDTNRFLILGVSIYSENGIIQKRIMLDLQGDHKAPVILSMLLQDFETSPTSNVRVIRETQMDFDNFQYSNTIL